MGKWSEKWWKLTGVKLRKYDKPWEYWDENLMLGFFKDKLKHNLLSSYRILFELNLKLSILLKQMWTFYFYHIQTINTFLIRISCNVTTDKIKEEKKEGIFPLIFRTSYKANMWFIYYKNN